MNAILIVDKPGGMTSHDVVKQVRKLAGESCLGHLGTLDPMASGVLPLLFGKFTRLARFFGDSTKEYVGTIRLGFSTDTFDAEGSPTSPAITCPLSSEEIRQAARPLMGRILQIPPPYSAKKIAGTPAYKLARNGKAVSLKPAAVEVHEFKIGERQGDLISFSSVVSSGTYMRSLARDLGEILGCGAHLASLRRTRVGQFSLDRSLGLEELKEEAGGTGDRSEVYRMRIIGHSIHPRAVLPDLPPVVADPQTVSRIAHGQNVNLPEFSGTALVKVFANRDELICIARRIAGTLFHPDVVLI